MIPLNKHNQSDDEKIIAALKNSDKKAFESLFHKYYPILCAYCHKFISQEDSEEITQDTLLWIWENRGNLPIEKNLSSYLFKSVYNKALNRLANANCRYKANTIYFEYMQNTLQDILYYKEDELIGHIREAISKLPESYRQAFVYHKFHDMTYKEIADILGISSKTVDYRIQQSMKILREDLKKRLQNYNISTDKVLTYIIFFILSR